MRKAGNNELKKINIKNCKYYYFDKITIIDDSKFENILLNKIPYGNNHMKLITLCLKLHTILKRCVLFFDKVMHISEK